MPNYFMGAEGKADCLQSDISLVGAIHESPLQTGMFCDVIEAFSSRRAPFCGRQAESLWEADIPPMFALHQHGTGLAAQSAFPSAPWPSLHKIFDQLIWR